MKKILLAGLSLLLIGISVKAQVIDAFPYVAGTVITFNIGQGTGRLTHSGSYAVELRQSGTGGTILPIHGRMERAFATGVIPTNYMSFFDYFDADDSGHVGEVLLNNLSPLAGRFTNSLFASTNVPSVVVGRQTGTFFRTEARADLNQDGDAELLWQHSDGTLAAWFMTNSIRGLIQLSNVLSGTYLDSLYIATGHMIDSNTPSIDPDWRIVAEKDFNGDGNLDWVWQNRTTGNLRLWEILTPFTGDSATSSNVIEVDISGQQPPDATTKLVGMSDFDNDTLPDFLYRAADGHLFIVYNGEEFNTEHIIGLGAPISTNWEVAAIADLDHNGWNDIIWQHTNGSIVVWLMKGAVHRSTVSLNGITASADLRIVANNDFNHDGNEDLLLRNRKTGRLVAWYLRGLTWGKTIILNGPALDWELVGPK